MMGPWRKRLRFALVGTLLWGAFLLAFAGPVSSIRPLLKDHVSNLHATIVFFYRGLDVARKPMQDNADAPAVVPPGYLEKHDWAESVYQIKEREGRFPLLGVWMAVPRPYPPGLYVQTTPWALWLENSRELSPWLVWSWVLSFVFFAHIAVFLLWERISLVPSVFLRFLLGFTVYAEIVGWSLCSQYDSLAALFAVLALRRWEDRRWLSFAGFFATSAFFHFRILFYLPLLLGFLWTERSWSDFSARVGDEWRTSKLGKKIWLAAAAGGAALSGIVFLWILKSVRDESEFNNRVREGFLSGVWVGDNWFFVIGLAILGIWIARRKDMTFGILGLWWAFFLNQMAFVRGWYCMFLVPVLGFNLGKKPTNADAIFRLLFYALFTSTIFRNSPFEFWFPKEVIEVIRDRWYLLGAGFF